MSQTIIEVNQLSKAYGKVKALENVSIAIKTGEIVALLGANGAGKTTLIQHLLGRLVPDEGQVSIAGFEPGSLNARQLIGAILQSTQMPSTVTVREQLELFSLYYPMPRPIDETLFLAGLTDLQDRRFAQLSGGQQQRLFFAIAICGNPKIVLLDEPTVGLDVNARRDFWNCIRSLVKQGVTVLLTTHYLEEAEILADRIIYLEHGEILFQGDVSTFKSSIEGKRIKFQTDTKLDELSRLEGVTHATDLGKFVELRSSDCNATLKELFKRNINVRDLTVQQISLEDAVVQMSSHLATSNTKSNSSSPTNRSEQAA